MADVAAGKHPAQQPMLVVDSKTATIQRSPKTFSTSVQYLPSKGASAAPSRDNSNARSLDVVPELAIKVTVLTTLNRARLWMLARQHDQVIRCFKAALAYAVFSCDTDLKYKCLDRINRYYRNIPVIEDMKPVSARSVLDEPAARLPMKPLKPKSQSAREGDISSPQFENEMMDRWVRAIMNGRVTDSPPPPTAGLPAFEHIVEALWTSTPRSSRRISSFGTYGYDRIDKLLQEKRNEPSRCRKADVGANNDAIFANNKRDKRFSEMEILHRNADLTTPTTASNHDLPSMTNKRIDSTLVKPINEMSGGLLARRRKLRPGSTSQAHPPVLGPSHQRSRSSSVDVDVTTISPMPVRRRSLDAEDSVTETSDDINPPLSVDGPSLSKLAKTMSVNPSSHSTLSTSSITTKVRSLSQSSTRNTPLLSLRTTDSAPSIGSSIGTAISSTEPVHHSPLRETFVPDSDFNETAQARADIVYQNTDPFASDKIPQTPITKLSPKPAVNSTKHSFESPKLIQTPRDNIAELSSYTSPNHRNADSDDEGDETMTEQDRLEAQEVVQNVLEPLKEVVTSARSSRSFRLSPKKIDAQHDAEAKPKRSMQLSHAKEVERDAAMEKSRAVKTKIEAAKATKAHSALPVPVRKPEDKSKSASEQSMKAASSPVQHSPPQSLPRRTTNSFTQYRDTHEHSDVDSDGVQSPIQHLRPQSSPRSSGRSIQQEGQQETSDLKQLREAMARPFSGDDKLSGYRDMEE